MFFIIKDIFKKRIFMNADNIPYEKYAPKTVEDVILPKNIKERFLKCIREQKIPNFGFWSHQPGLGKSCTSKAIIRSSGADALFLNASLEKGIDVIRNKVMQFASSVSLSDAPKIVVFDEADNISPDAQASLRGFLDEFSSNCSFIFTGNLKSKIIEPLLDRLENYDFSEFPKEEMVKPIFEKLKFIVQNEGYEFDSEKQQLVISIIQNSYPKIRDMIKTLVKSLETNSLVFENSISSFEEILESLKKKDYYKIIEQTNSLTNPDGMFEFLYARIKDFSKIPGAIQSLAKGQYQSAFVRDKNLNLASTLCELMNYI